MPPSEPELPPLQPSIPPPSGALSPTPDPETRKGLRDYTSSEGADERVLHINFGFFRYGTNDKAHAAAIVLSMALLLVIVLLMAAGLFSTEAAWKDKLFGWLGTAFTFVSGVAVGKAVPELSEKRDE